MGKLPEQRDDGRQQTFSEHGAAVTKPVLVESTTHYNMEAARNLIPTITARARRLGLMADETVVSGNSNMLHSVGVAERILDVLEQGGAGIVHYPYSKDRSNLYVVSPDGTFNGLLDYSGTLLVASIPTEQGRTDQISYSRIVETAAPSSKEHIKRSGGNIRVDFGADSHYAIYGADSRLRRLGYHVYVDSTSSHDLTTDINPATGEFSSNYTPPSGIVAGRIDEPIFPGSPALPYKIGKNDRQMISMRQRGLARTEQGLYLYTLLEVAEPGEEGLRLVAAPLEAPALVRMAQEPLTFTDNLIANWSTVYPQLQHHAPVLHYEYF